MAVFAFDTAIVVLQRVYQVGLGLGAAANLGAFETGDRDHHCIAVVLGTPRVLQSATSRSPSASFQNSTYAARTIGRQRTECRTTRAFCMTIWPIRSHHFS